MPRRHERVDLHKVVDSVIEQVLPQLAEGVHLQKRVYTTPAIVGDGDRIAQAREQRMQRGIPWRRTQERRRGYAAASAMKAKA